MAERGGLDNDSPMVEVFALFPHESATVMQRGIEFGIVCSSLLVLHCLWLGTWSPEPGAVGDWDLQLRLLCFARVVLAAPRPYFWMRTRRLFLEARCQPTPQLVTQRLMDIYAHPFGVERRLLMLYYSWLALATLLALVLPGAPDEITFASKLWNHCMMNYVTVVLHRLLCLLFFYHLRRSDIKRGIPREILEQYSLSLTFGRSGSRSQEELGRGELECSICYGGYVAGDGLRKLHCGHHFHKRCVDVWLLGHQNKCPLCLHLVGPRDPREASKHVEMTRGQEQVPVR